MAVKGYRDTVVQVIGIAFYNRGNRAMAFNGAGNFVTFAGDTDVAKKHSGRAGYNCAAVCGFVANADDGEHRIPFGDKYL